MLRPLDVSSLFQALCLKVPYSGGVFAAALAPSRESHRPQPSRTSLRQVMCQHGRQYDQHHMGTFFCSSKHEHAGQQSAVLHSKRRGTFCSNRRHTQTVRHDEPFFYIFIRILPSNTSSPSPHIQLRVDSYSQNMPAWACGAVVHSSGQHNQDCMGMFCSSTHQHAG